MTTTLHWFRRDLRAHDNTALIAAAREAGRDGRLVAAFVVDERWWNPERGQLGPFQARFWLESLTELRAALGDRGIPLVVRRGDDPVDALLRLAAETGADSIHYNRDTEPDQLALDRRLAKAAAGRSIAVHEHLDATLFGGADVLNKSGRPYAVFTPYSRAYRLKLAEAGVRPAGLPPRTAAAARIALGRIPTLGSLGFTNVALEIEPGEKAARKRLQRFVDGPLEDYAQTRDFPAGTLARPQGTSRLSAHLNAGTISIRQAFAAVLEHPGEDETFLTELIWREFSRMLLEQHPSAVSRPLDTRFDAAEWANDPAAIAAWSEGRTGYPLVDAAMAELRTTGFMHNRLRMVVATFLTKHLDVGWTVGERFFRRTLMDYDQAANVCGWQWSASTGTDAAPYFRVMSPIAQSQRWDTGGTFIRHHLPVLRHVPEKHVHTPWTMSIDEQRDARCVIGRDYPAPIVDQAAARAAAIERFRRMRT